MQVAFHSRSGLMKSRVHIGHDPQDVPGSGEGAQASACQFASRRATLAETVLALAETASRMPKVHWT